MRWRIFVPFQIHYTFYIIYWFVFLCGGGEFDWLILQRNSIEAASNFGCRNRLPAKLKVQILAYMCLRFKAESLNQQHLLGQLPQSICKNIFQHLFLPTVEKVYLFKGISKENLLNMVRKYSLMLLKKKLVQV